MLTEGASYYNRNTNTCDSNHTKECTIYKKLMYEKFITIGAALRECNYSG